ncbi:MAG: glycoside hydrolase family 92 protein [Prevotella sp.]|nr:glycoside hydrolase family 92 protein [Prevotella sp.]
MERFGSRFRLSVLLAMSLFNLNLYSQLSTVWKIGEQDNSSAEFALGPSEFDVSSNNVVQARSAISMVSIVNASENLQKEITEPFGWNFDAVVAHHKEVWNDMLLRLTITSSDRMEKMRFYTNLYRAL